MPTRTTSGYWLFEPKEWDGWEAMSLREQAGLTQDQFAAYVLGCSARKVCQIEAAGRNYHFKNRLQRSSMDALQAKLREEKNWEPPKLDGRWGSRGSRPADYLAVKRAELRRVEDLGWKRKDITAHMKAWVYTKPSIISSA